MLLHVHRQGSGRPIVVLPAYGIDHVGMTMALEPAFAGAAGWQRLYVDLPGTGGVPATEPTADAVLDCVVETIRGELGDQRFLLAGWSFGGYLAAGVVRRMPSHVAGLLMICSGFKILPEDRDLSGVLDSAPAAGWLDGVEPDLQEHLQQAVGLQTASVAGRIVQMLDSVGATDDDFLATLRARGFALSDEDEATPCDGPVLLVAGRRDRVAGYRGLLRSMESYDHATFLAESESGHYLPLERPRVFAAAVQSWLEMSAEVHPERG
jgi:pimeloyl-ACP methyl ester carboxylesterase